MVTWRPEAVSRLYPMVMQRWFSGTQLWLIMVLRQQCFNSFWFELQCCLTNNTVKKVTKFVSLSIVMMILINWNVTPTMQKMSTCTYTDLVIYLSSIMISATTPRSTEYCLFSSQAWQVTLKNIHQLQILQTILKHFINSIFVVLKAVHATNTVPLTSIVLRCKSAAYTAFFLLFLWISGWTDSILYILFIIY